jgi:hypothetical protein
MERSVSGLFTDYERAESAVGAIRADGIDAARITVVSPDGTTPDAGVHAGHGIGKWLAAHLQRGHAHEQAQEVTDHVATGGWLVRVNVRTDEEDRSVRTLFVTAGSKEISSLADGTMVPVERPVGTGVGQ